MEAINILLIYLGLLAVAAIVWHAATREPDPLEDQDWRGGVVESGVADLATR